MMCACRYLQKPKYIQLRRELYRPRHEKRTEFRGVDTGISRLGLQANSTNLFLSDIIRIFHCQINNLLRFKIVSLCDSTIEQGTDILSI